ncbi:hypothetical protein [Pedobacter nutrimenti]|jgi:hypothetical protein|uniref:Uncharacterized protein n=1 Tax=Pedobacter nutrimenti TaxID=1241337 RepID=A0A318UG24_9SPHI|nr:hypothetical protein [Pedobacter nutrimenti]PYF74317.1 hypothetical protein B0O44_104488 [Pedobacter nutrimenti]
MKKIILMLFVLGLTYNLHAQAPVTPTDYYNKGYRDAQLLIKNAYNAIPDTGGGGYYQSDNTPYDPSKPFGGGNGGLQGQVFGLWGPEYDNFVSAWENRFHSNRHDYQVEPDPLTKEYYRGYNNGILMADVLPVSPGGMLFYGD